MASLAGVVAGTMFVAGNPMWAGVGAAFLVSGGKTIFGRVFQQIFLASPVEVFLWTVCDLLPESCRT